MEQTLKEKAKAFFPGFWRLYRHYVLSFVGFFSLPSVLHVNGFSRVGCWLFWMLLGLLALDVLFRLPRFIKSVWNHKNKPYQGWCIVDFALYVTAILVGTGLAKLVGLF